MEIGVGVMEAVQYRKRPVLFYFILLFVIWISHHVTY